MTIVFPTLRRGRRNAHQEQIYRDELDAFVAGILEIKSTLDFKVSARGWCYILEEHGLAKGDFDKAEALINSCRKSGSLPLDICAEDDSRAFTCIEYLDDADPAEYVTSIWSYVDGLMNSYRPISFWEDKPVYLQILVEKVDLKSLFEPVCRRYAVPIANACGWSDINLRANLMRRFAQHEQAGRQCVLLYCGDHDPAGLRISATLHDNLTELSDAVGWNPDNLVIDRFGLNAEFMHEHGLSWIDNLETSSGKNLASNSHSDHYKDYVQSYLRKFGARKVEANSLVTRPEAGRRLCEQAILKYLSKCSTPEQHGEKLKAHRQQVRSIIKQVPFTVGSAL